MLQLVKHTLPAAALAALLTALLAGCGGGGGSATPTASVAGTAATGAAIASGTVTLKCVSGTTTGVTTGTDGSFSIDVSSVTLPCVGRVDYKDSTGAAQKLHTFVTAAGTANITPVTDLLVANLTGGAAAAAFDSFDGTKAKAITAAQVKAAADAVKAYLKNTLGVDTTNLPDDPVGTKLAAKTGSSAGDKFDAVLDDLAARLKGNGKTLADVAGDISKGSSGGTVPTAGTMVVSGASNAARNGSYVVAGAKFTSGTDFGFNGQTADGKFEMEVVLSSGFVVQRAHVWFFDANNVIKTFGCDGGKAIACTGIGWEPLLKQVLFNNNARLAEVNADLTGRTPDSLVPGGETLTAVGSVEIK
jgi:hypothetical protein